MVAPPSWVGRRKSDKPSQALASEGTSFRTEPTKRPPPADMRRGASGVRRGWAYTVRQVKQPEGEKDGKGGSGRASMQRRRSPEGAPGERRSIHGSSAQVKRAWARPAADAARAPSIRAGRTHIWHGRRRRQLVPPPGPPAPAPSSFVAGFSLALRCANRPCLSRQATEPRRVGRRGGPDGARQAAAARVRAPLRGARGGTLGREATTDESRPLSGGSVVASCALP